MNLGALFDSASRSVVRVETLGSYDVGGDEAASLEAWRVGRPRPERSVRTNGYLRRVAAAVARGLVWERLRVIDTPPTEYQQWELLAYQESQAVGETVRIARWPDMKFRHLGDYWIIDRGAPGCVVIAMDYGPHGEFHGSWPIDRWDIPFAAADSAAEAGIPLNVYLAGSGAVQRAS